MWVDVNQRYVDLGLFPQWYDIARKAENQLDWPNFEHFPGIKIFDESGETNKKFDIKGNFFSFFLITFLPQKYLYSPLNHFLWGITGKHI